jgi:MOSC domain-containing protein YiiM
MNKVKHNARVKQIFICEKNGGVLLSKTSVDAVAGAGLKGDRNFKPAEQGCNKNAITLIEAEASEICRQRTKKTFPVSLFRRNLVVEGVNLNELVGKNFKVGEVDLRGYELCHPCRYLSEMLDSDLLSGLAMCGGLRAEILSTGKIKVEDKILPAKG